MQSEPDIVIRSESSDDVPRVRSVNKAAFDTPAEAALVDLLRERANPVVSLVARIGTDVVGHIMFSPVELYPVDPGKIMGLAPMAVHPEWQNHGIGTALVRDGLKQCRDIEISAVVVLGHPHFYARFGFLPASVYGITSEYDVPDGVFRILELEAGSLPASGGTVRYHEVFGQF